MLEKSTAKDCKISSQYRGAKSLLTGFREFQVLSKNLAIYFYNLVQWWLSQNWAIFPRYQNFAYYASMKAFWGLESFYIFRIPLLENLIFSHFTMGNYFKRYQGLEWIRLEMESPRFGCCQANLFPAKQTFNSNRGPFLPACWASLAPPIKRLRETSRL